MKDPFLHVLLDKEIKDSFSVIEWNDQELDAPSMYRATYNRLFLLQKGTGSLRVDEETYPLSGYELFLVAKGQLFGFGESARITGYELCFGDCFWERSPASASNCKAVLFNNASANQRIPVEETYYRELDTLFRMLYQEFSKESYTNQLDALAAWLKIIMIKIANINAALLQGYDSYEKQLYRQFVELVSKQYKTTHEVADFSGQLGIPARKLTDLCKRCSGKGAKDIINGQLIAEAKRSLQFSSQPVKEIAFQLNFSSPDQFSHFFKKNTLVSPNDYRSHFVNIDR